jgi:hypothetical protein
VTEKQETAVETAAQKVLDVRKEFPGSPLADLYDPVAMPPKLVKAHAELDRAVDGVTGPKRSPATGTGWSSCSPSTSSNCLIILIVIIIEIL